MEKSVSIAVFYDEDGKILLQDRRKISKHGEQFGFFGGHMEKGEAPEEALRREIKEELTYELDNFSFFKKYGPRQYKESEYFITNFVFLVKLPDLSEFKQNEGEGMQLFSIKDAKKLKLVSSDYFILDDLNNYFYS